MSDLKSAAKLALEALEQTLQTLDDENAKPGGAIADTIWHSEHETLFDYLGSEIIAIKEALAQPEQEPVAVFYLPIRKDMREDVEALIDHAKRARWTNVVVRKDAVETTYEADWIKELIPYTPPQRTEQNFCSRCGKRTKDIHTCTPPREGT
jgi:hypothetical protein